MKHLRDIIDDGSDQIIYKNDNERTSLIISLYQVDNDYIIVTHNTIYIISANTKIETNT
jgi:hypothetical protein